MPERKGRRNRPARDRRRERASEPAAAVGEAEQPPPSPQRAPAHPRSAATQQPQPSTTARATGFMIAIITLVLAVVMIYNAASGDLAGIDLVLRLVAGVLLVLLAVVVGALSLAPGAIRTLIMRRRGRAE